MPIVVSDTSTIRALNGLGLMELLSEFYQEVLVPPAVVAELIDPPPGLGIVVVGDVYCLKVVAPIDSDLILELLDSLDLGEAETIALALECKADLILMDESEGRAACLARGMMTMGALGILVRAKRSGKIDAVLPLIDRLQKELRFFVSSRLRAAVLRSVDE